MQQPLDLRFDLVQAADARAEDHAAAEGVFLGEVDAGVAHGVDAGDHGELREAIDAAWHPWPTCSRRCVQSWTSPPKWTLWPAVSNSRIVWMPLSPRRIALPEVFDLATERGDGSQSGYDDTPFHASPLTTGNFSMYSIAWPTV